MAHYLVAAYGQLETRVLGDYSYTGATRFRSEQEQNTDEKVLLSGATTIYEVLIIQMYSPRDVTGHKTSTHSLITDCCGEPRCCTRDHVGTYPGAKRFSTRCIREGNEPLHGICTLMASIHSKQLFRGKKEKLN
jgi:hypothetical protein